MNEKVNGISPASRVMDISTRHYCLMCKVTMALLGHPDGNKHQFHCNELSNHHLLVVSKIVLCKEALKYLEYFCGSLLAK